MGAHSRNNYITLSKWLSKSNLENEPNLLLQMDIEGGEIEIFEKQDLQFIEKIIFENHYTKDKNQNMKISKALKGFGYKLIETNGKVEIWIK